MNPTTLIAVDIGNSTTKVGWFDEAAAANHLPQPALVRDFPTGQNPPAGMLAELTEAPVRWRVVSVQRDGQRVLSRWIETHRPQDDVRVLTHTDLPIEVRLEFPDRVGTDRLAAAVATNRLRDAGRPAIVVDAGTAVTVDLLSGDGDFLGGVILAGFRMQAEVLFETADLLPLALLEPSAEPPPVVGTSTEGAIKSGLFWGAVGAVREIVARMGAQLDQPPRVFVTGGDLARLAPLVGDRARYVPNLVLAGIAIAARRT
jgi:type III pantothenate kinase